MQSRSGVTGKSRLSRLADRSSELDKREEKIRCSERCVSDAANAVEIEKMKLQELEAKAEKKLKAAENEYNEQLELNKRYSELEREIRKVKRERDCKTTEGKRGKILISKTALLEYLGGAA